MYSETNISAVRCYQPMPDMLHLHASPPSRIGYTNYTSIYTYSADAHTTLKRIRLLHPASCTIRQNLTRHKNKATAISCCLAWAPSGWAVALVHLPGERHTEVLASASGRIGTTHRLYMKARPGLRSSRRATMRSLCIAKGTRLCSGGAQWP